MTVRSLVFWVATLCCVVAEFAILRSLLFGRARQAERTVAESARVRAGARPVEIAWALLPALGLLFVLYLTWRAVEKPQAPASDVSHAGETIGA